MDTVDYSIVELLYLDFYTSDTCQQSCFLDNATKGFLSNEYSGRHFPTCGVNNSDGSAIAHALPMIVRYPGKAHMLDYVENMVRVVQDSDAAVVTAHVAALILEQVGCVYCI